MPGHNNYDPSQGRSEIGADVNPQELVDQFAGRGQPVGQVPPGQAGSRERFDTGDRVIGIYRDRDGVRSAPTTVGQIHYGAEGRVHIVPARPRGWQN
ncbi:polymorphic toxin type 50 domain-containing protein [Rhodovarius sp.]|uniref:polymorphic toxin type 50 domain-containing protein n=1 Tax=Rhodovarius sp. TaxID=2972673 RepID=UPI0033413435